MPDPAHASFDVPSGEVPVVVTNGAWVADDKPTWQVRIFTSHAYFRLWLAQVVSAMGDWIGFLAIAAAAYRIGGGSPETAVGLVMSARIVPGFFLGPVAGVLIDRWDRKRLMVACDLGRAAVLLFLPFITHVWELLVASLLLEVCTLLWSPAKEASVPNIVPADRLTTANSLSLVAAYGTFPFASALFAGLAGVAKTLDDVAPFDSMKLQQESVAFWFDTVTFTFSAFMISRLAFPRLSRDERRAQHEGGDWRQAFIDLKEGWQFVFLNPVVRAVNVGLATGLVGAAMLVPLGPVFADEVLGSGTAGFGLLTTALGIGVAFGVLMLSVAQKRLPKERTFTGAVFVAGASLIGAASTSTLAPAMAFVLVIGTCGGAVYVLGFTLLHETVADELRGRIFSALYTMVRLCVLLAFGAAPLLSGQLSRLSKALTDDGVVTYGEWNLAVPGVRLTLWLAGLIVLGAGVLALRSLKAGGALDPVEPVPETAGGPGLGSTPPSEPGSTS